MLLNLIPMDVVAECTGLPLETIQKLAKTQEKLVSVDFILELIFLCGQEKLLQCVLRGRRVFRRR